MLRTRCLWLFAAVVAGAAAAFGQGATRAPASSAAKGVDHVRDLIDGYFQGYERERFFLAAGVDGELSKEEFAAAAGKPNSFVRPYDQWNSAMVFDADHDAQLNWVEAEQYRLAIRKRVLALFDRDGDGQLAGPERAAANAFLAAGMGRLAIIKAPTSQPILTTRPAGPDPWAGRAAPLPSTRPSPQPSWPGHWREVQAAYDANKDGQLTGSERQHMEEGLRDHYRKDLLQRFDKNRNGKLDQAELVEVEMEDRREAMRWRQQAELERWDADKDGQLGPAERAAMDKHLTEARRQAERRRQQWVKRWDKDGDGELSSEERLAVTQELRERVALQRTQMDADGDGKLTAKEIRAYRKRLFEEPR